MVFQYSEQTLIEDLFTCQQVVLFLSGYSLLLTVILIIMSISFLKKID